MARRLLAIAFVLAALAPEAFVSAQQNAQSITTHSPPSHDDRAPLRAAERKPQQPQHAASSQQRAAVVQQRVTSMAGMPRNISRRQSRNHRRPRTKSTPAAAKKSLNQSVTSALPSGALAGSWDAFWVRLQATRQISFRKRKARPTLDGTVFRGSTSGCPERA